MRRNFRWLGALLSAVVLATTIQTLVPGAVQAAVLPDTGWGGTLSYRAGDPTVNGQVFDIHWMVSPALVTPETVRFPNPSFTQRGSWQLDYTNRGTDICVIDGELKEYPWTQTGHSTGTGNVTVKYPDAGDPTHYFIGATADGPGYTVVVTDPAPTPCATHDGGDVGIGTFFNLPVAGMWATDASNYTHISGNDVNGTASGTWSLSRTNITNIAGYELTSGPQTSASAAFTIPALTCPKSGARGILSGAWLGSTAPTAAYAEVLCRNGVPVYGAGAWLNGTQHRFAMTPRSGDRMTVSVT